MADIGTMQEQLQALEAQLGSSVSMVATFDGELSRMRETMIFTGREVNTLSSGLSGGLRKAFDGLVFDGMKLNDALKSVAPRTPVDVDQLGGIGFCFGGAVVLDLARSGADVAGVVSFHGNLSTSIPAQAGDVKASLLVLNGADDTYVPAEQIATFQQEMTAAKADWQFVNYSGAVHCFAEADANSPGCLYEPRAAKRAYAAMDSFFDEKFED